MRKGAGKGPPRFGCGEGTLAVDSVVGPLALVPASNHLPTPTHTSATTHSPHPAPASVKPPPAHQCVSHVLPHAASAPRPRPLGMRAAPRHARHPAPVPPAPVSVDPGVVAAPTALVVVKCALVPATPCNQHHHSSRNRARRTPLTPSVLARRTPPRSRPLKPPRPSPPRTPVRQSCPAAGCQRATPPPAGHARRPETRQAPRARAARTCFR